MAMFNYVMQINRRFDMLNFLIYRRLDEIFLVFNFFNVRCHCYANATRCNSFNYQPYVIRITTRLLTARCSIQAAMEFARNGDCLKRDNFAVDMRRLNSIRSCAVVFLAHAQGRSQGICRYRRQGIRYITRTGRTYAFT